MAIQKKGTNKQPSKLAVDVVEVRSLVLVDEAGGKRIEFFCSRGDGDSGCSVVHMYDDAGRPRITLQIDSSGNPGVILFTPNNASGVSLAVSEAGNGLGIHDGEGRSGISIGCPGPASNDSRGPGPKIDVIDRAAKRTWSVFEGTTNDPTDSTTT